jgi:hypothetical protein
LTADGNSRKHSQLLLLPSILQNEQEKCWNRRHAGKKKKKKKRTGHGPHSIHLSANEFKKPKVGGPFFLRCARGAYIIKGHASGHGHFTPKTKRKIFSRMVDIARAGRP